MTTSPTLELSTIEQPSYGVLDAACAGIGEWSPTATNRKFHVAGGALV